MDNKIIAAALACIIALSGWSLTTTVGLKTDVALLKQQVEEIEKKVSKFKPNKKKKKKKN
jgi:hypothetical protein|tara:strand:+ start:196 stop:375 length:180 start_codon:yes stop_codon:yes gene_type:complete